MAIDMSAAKAPPAKRSATTRASTPKTAPTPPAEGKKSVNDLRRDGLLGLAQLVGGVCLVTGQYADAAAIGRHFPPLAKAAADLADENETVAKPIDFLIQIGPYGAIIAAGLPLVLQLLANHKVIDASAMSSQGVVPPAVLEAQMKAEVAKMQAEAVRSQQEAVHQAQEAQAEYEAMMREYSVDAANLAASSVLSSPVG